MGRFALTLALGQTVLMGCSDAGQVIGHRVAQPVSTARPAFEAPTAMAELCVPDAKDQDPTLTEDLLEIFFFSERDGLADLFTSRRASLDDPWEEPRSVSELNSDVEEINPAVSRDGLRIWFHSRRDEPGIWFSERASREDAWTTPVRVAELTFEGGVIAPGPSADELRMALSVFDSTEEHREIYESVRESTSDPWGPMDPLPGLNGPGDDSTPFLVGEGLAILMSSSRSGSGDLFWARRATWEEEFGTPEPIEEINDPDAFDSHPHLSADGTRIFFGSERGGATDLYEAQVMIP